MDKIKCIKFLNTTFLFIFIALGTIGGCGGGGGENGSSEIESSTDVAFACQSPPLNTDFSDRGIFFVDSANAVLIGITSDGNLVSILLSDIPDSGARVGVGARTTSANVCEVIAGAVDFDMDLEFTDELFFEATGEGRLEDDFSIFVIEDLEIAGVPLGVDLNGDCDEIIFFEDSSENLTRVNEYMLDKLQGMATKEGNEEESGLILDFYEDINLISK